MQPFNQIRMGPSPASLASSCNLSSADGDVDRHVAEDDLGVLCNVDRHDGECDFDGLSVGSSETEDSMLLGQEKSDGSSKSAFSVMSVAQAIRRLLWIRSRGAYKWDMQPRLS